MTGLILGGNIVGVDGLDVRTWNEHGMQFAAGTKKAPSFNRRRTSDPNLIVEHWTGAENDAKSIFRNLNRRKLGIHFYIDYDGVVWQYADPSVLTCAHAGAVNGRSIGIENQNAGFPKGAKPNFPRAKTKVRVKGRTVTMLMFNSNQLDANGLLVEALCDHYDIPKVIPGTDDDTFDILYDNTPKKYNKTFEGVIGHLHVSKKVCPGFGLLEGLVEDGFDTMVLR